MECLLVIEDSKVAQAQLADILDGRYRLEFCETGPAGVSRALQIIPDLILLDIHLPNMDGYQVCRILKQDARSSEIPVIFITSMSAEKEKVRGFEAGAEDYIVKPFYRQELVARINLHLASRHARQQAFELERLKVLQSMASALGQEMGGPLRAAYAALDRLEREDAAELQAVYLSDIHTELDLMRNIIDKLSGVARATGVQATEFSEIVECGFT